MMFVRHEVEKTIGDMHWKLEHLLDITKQASQDSEELEKVKKLLEDEKSARSAENVHWNRCSERLRNVELDLSQARKQAAHYKLQAELKDIELKNNEITISNILKVCSKLRDKLDFYETNFSNEEPV